MFFAFALVPPPAVPATAPCLSRSTSRHQETAVFQVPLQECCDNIVQIAANEPYCADPCCSQSRFHLPGERPADECIHTEGKNFSRTAERFPADQGSQFPAGFTPAIDIDQTEAVRKIEYRRQPASAVGNRNPHDTES